MKEKQTNFDLFFLLFIVNLLIMFNKQIDKVILISELAKVNCHYNEVFTVTVECVTFDDTPWFK